MNQYKNYGLRISDTPDAGAYKIGGISLPKVVLQPDGNWSNFLPVYEPQFEPDFDTFNCTAFGTTNIIEILFKKMYNM